MNDKFYYTVAGEASKNMSWHPGIKTIIRLARKSHAILDVGCGEGSKLNEIVGKTKNGFGIDINQYAIGKANQQYPRHSFKHYDGKIIPFPGKSFGFVYSTFVLEHTENPQRYLEEMIRVTKKNGTVAILCPNYGAPNRRSPVSAKNPFLKLLNGYFGDLFCRSRDLRFTRVTPRKIFKNIDDDTTCEPYLHQLISFISRFPNIKIKQATSLWEIDADAKSLHQRLFKFFGQKNIFPFRYWGPQLLVLIKKTA